MRSNMAGAAGHQNSFARHYFQISAVILECGQIFRMKGEKTPHMILVTGGAGYIGSHTVKALKAAGLQPLIFDNFSTGHRSFVKNTPLFEGDLCKPGDLERAFK